MIYFEKICKERPKDSQAICLFVNSMRDCINKLFEDRILTVVSYLDLPFPEIEKANYHLGAAEGVLNLALAACFINENEFLSFCEQIAFILSERKAPNEFFKLKPW